MDAKVLMGGHAGPCDTPCEHFDCAETRRIAATPCSLCGKAIGYEMGFYDHPLRHAVCVESEENSR